MQHPIEESAPGELLTSPFRPKGGLGVFTKLRLLSDRLEVVRFGLVTRTVALSAIESVAFESADEPVNLRLRVRGGEPLAGHVEGVALWRIRLSELLGLGTEANLPQPRVRLTPAA